MQETRSKSGKTIYYATRGELEGLPGYRGNDHRGRACCPIHNGDNPQALSIDWVSGWAHCFSCGDAFAIRVADHPDTNPPRDRPTTIRHPRANAAQTREDAPESPIPPQTTPNTSQDVSAGLEAAIAGACDRLPGSPGAAYLAGRGIALEVAQALRLGWAVAGPLAGRVVFPFTDSDGRPVGATGRAISDNATPKYKALAGKDGYQKLLFNGGAIAQARRAGHPVIICEGPVDAAACFAAGLPLAVAINGKTYKHPEHFAGLERAVLALDSDDAGQGGRADLYLALTALGVSVLLLPAAALEGCNDLGEYWQRYGRMPAQLAAASMGPHRRGLGTPRQTAASDPAPRELAEYERRRRESRPDLPAELIAEAEADAAELAQDAAQLADFEAMIDRERARLEYDNPDLLRASEYAIELARTAFDHDQLGA